MKTVLFVSVGVCALASSTVVWAEMAAELDAVVVTANRTSQSADRVGGQISIVDDAAIRAQQTPIVSDILRRLPGVSLSRNGGPGTATQLRIRGAESDQTVVLIDGVKLNDPSATGGGYNFGNLLIGDVERLEVLRGAQSVLWGSQALGGVVNVITRDATEPFEADGKLEGGSMGTAYGRVGLGGKGERVTWRATAGYFTTDGVSAFNRSRGGRERDGYANLGASGKARVTLAETLSLDLRAVYSRGRAEVDGFPAPAFSFADTAEYGVTRDLIGYAGLNLDVWEGRLTHRVAAAYTATDRDNFNPDQANTTRTFDAAGYNRRLEYQGTLRMTPEWLAVFGAERERSRFRTASPSSANPKPAPGRRKAELDGVYGQVSGTVAPGLTLTGGLRYDEHGDFGGHTSAQVSAAWVIANATVLRASYGDGFKAPSLFQLGSEFGNPGLRPESANSWDAGVEQRLLEGRIVLSAAYFHRRTSNQIDFFSCAAASANPLCFGVNGLRRSGFYANTARTRTEGVELEARAQVTEALSLTANYTLTDARNDSPGSANRGKRLQRRPGRQGYAEAAYRWPIGLSAAVAVEYAGDRFDDVSNRSHLGAYTLWDLRAAYPVTDRIEVYGRVENIFDKRYETIRLYGQPGRTAYAGVRARF